MANQDLRILFVLAALLGASAFADPPTPSKPPPPDPWEFIGKYPNGVGAGLVYLNAVIERATIHRAGNIVDVHVGRDFVQLEGSWVPQYPTGSIAYYKIDCKYDTYREFWWEWESGTDAGVRNEMPDRWISIEPDTPEALAEKRVCKKA
jgi:hypothetical protein